ncbi:MAG TPA: hypothetical protein VFP84_40125 [Kofleriaceae bacterium]|nr:hypothetical protein [Kofleriaceae bacterium]
MNQRIARTPSSGADAENLAESLRALFEQGVETLGALRSKVSTIRDVTQRGSQLVDSATALVEKRPLASVAAAFGIGYIAMRIQTSKLTPLLVMGGLAYLGVQRLSRT